MITPDDPSPVRLWSLDEFLSQLQGADFISELFELAQAVGTLKEIDAFGNFIIDLPIVRTMVIGSDAHPDELSIVLSRSNRPEYEQFVANMRRYISKRSDALIVEHHFFDETNTSQVALGRRR